MINGILAFQAPGAIEWIVIFIFVGIPIFLIFFAVRFISKGSKERQKLRMELGKLSEELEQIRNAINLGKYALEDAAPIPEPQTA